MPYQKRHEGMCVLERFKAAYLSTLALFLLRLCLILPANAVTNAIVGLAVSMIAAVSNASNYVSNGIDPVNPANRNRNVASFTAKECWDYLRFRKGDLNGLIISWGYPRSFH